MQAARLIDLSKTGAQIWDGPSLPLESRGIVSLDSVALPLPLPFVVRHIDNQGRLNVEFEATEAVRSAVSRLLERLQQTRAA